MRRLPLRAAFLAVALVLVPGAVRAQATADPVQQIVARAVAAHDAGDVRGFRRHMEEAYRLAPRDPDVAYNMACAYALTGDADRAIALLEVLANAGFGKNAIEDRDFDAIRSHPRFRAVIARIARGERGAPPPKTSRAWPPWPSRRPAPAPAPAPGPAPGPSPAPTASTPVFTIPEQDLLPSAIAYDPVDRRFYTTSLRHRKIMVTDREGATREFIAEGQDGFPGGFGIAVDPLRRVLWAAGAMTPQVPGYTPAQAGTGAIHKYDLRTGKLRRTIPLAAGRWPHLPLDIAVDPQSGAAYVSDAGTGAVYVVGPGEGAVRTLVREGFFREPRALALAPGGGRLFVSHAGGIAWLDPWHPTPYGLGHAPGTVLGGVHSLAHDGEALVAVQPDLARVVRLELNAEQTFVERAVVLEAGHPLFAGRLGRGTLGPEGYYVLANTSAAAFDADGRLARRDALSAPVVLRVPVEPDTETFGTGTTR